MGGYGGFERVIVKRRDYVFFENGKIWEGPDDLRPPSGALEFRLEMLRSRLAASRAGLDGSEKASFRRKWDQICEGRTEEDASRAESGAEPAKREVSEVLTNFATKDKYERIRNGMNYDSVREIMGGDGEERSRSVVAGISTAAYAWSNPDGGNMLVIFQDGRLVQKSQAGLK